MTAPNRPAADAAMRLATINTAADILREYIARESPDLVPLLFNADYEGMAMALDAAGRLLPPDTDTRTEWAVYWPGIDRDVSDLRAEFGVDAEAHVRGVVERNRGAELRSRSVSTFADGSTLVGPWVSVRSTPDAES